MGGTDPTRDFLARLRDESKWEMRYAIPIFEPHTRIGVGPDGKPKKIEVTAEDLPAIAAECNRLEREKGVVGLLTDRHTIRPRYDESGKMVGYEPVPGAVTLGYQRNYRVGTYSVTDPDTGLTKQLPAILVDWHLYPDKAQEADRRPHRSVEYQAPAKLIRGTAIMVNAPFLDMGMVALSQSGRATTSDTHLYAMGYDMPGTEEPKTGEEKKPEGPQHTPEEEKLFEKCCAYMRTKYGLDEGWPAAKKEEPKNPDDPKKTEEEKAKEPVTPMESTKQIELFQQQLATEKAAREETQRQLAAAHARMDGILLQMDQERCQAMIYSLESEGFRLSEEERKKELSKLANTKPAERPDRIKELRAIYAERKVPGNQLVELYQGHVEPGANDTGPMAVPAYHAAAMTYMRDHPGTSYDSAVEFVKRNQPK